MQERSAIMLISIDLIALFGFTGIAHGVYHAEMIWQSPPFDNPAEIVVGDTDKDGHKEIIFADEQRGRIYVFEHTGGHSYVQVWESLQLGTSMEGIATGDADSDGKEEILTWTDSPGKFYVFENTGDNSYSKVYEKEVSGEVDDIGVGDADNDGKKEILVGAHYYIRVYENTGDNSYSEVWNYQMQYYNPNGVTVDDTDNDGIPEIIVSDEHKIYVFENTGDDTYDVSWISDYLSEFLGRIVTGDADKDSKKEMIVGGPHIYVFENSGDNDYVMVWERNVSGIFPAVGDSDQDGKDEFILGYHIFENDGDNDYKEVWFNDSCYGHTCGDTDNDGQYEIIGDAPSGSDEMVQIWEVIDPIPALSEWGMILVILLMMGIGSITLRKRRLM